MKKHMGIKFIFLIALMIFMPLKTYAADSSDELQTCTYFYDEEELVYTIYEDDIGLPFINGDEINHTNWYHEDDFKSRFLSSMNTSNQKHVCPSIVIDKDELFTTVFLNTKDEAECNGTCQKIFSSNSNNDINVIWTKMGPSVAKFQSSEYFLPVFRKLSDGTLEWSIDNQNFYDIHKKIVIDKNNIVSIEDTFLEKVFTNEENISNIYRCIFYSNGVLEYKLSIDGTYCRNNILSNQDNQVLGSLYYHSLLGANDDEISDTCDTILGNPEQPDTVAWLLNKVLGYLKILGPMLVIIFSVIDFTKIIVSGDDEQAQKIYKKFIYRLILIVVLFFLPTLIMALLRLFHFTSDPICSFK